MTPESTGYQASPFEETANIGVPVAPFPRWQVCPYCRLLAPIHSGLFELKVDLYRKDRCRYVNRICRKPGTPPIVVPARFLVACEHGHLDDFPWVAFAHRGPTECPGELQLFELGASGEVADIEVQCMRCDNARRRISDAFTEDGKAELSACRGRWPHLRSRPYYHVRAWSVWSWTTRPAFGGNAWPGHVVDEPIRSSVTWTTAPCLAVITVPVGQPLCPQASRFLWPRVAPRP